MSEWNADDAILMMYYIIDGGQNQVDDYGVLLGPLEEFSSAAIYGLYDPDEEGGVSISGTKISEETINAVIEDDYYGITPGIAMYSDLTDMAGYDYGGVTFSWQRFPYGSSKSPVYGVVLTDIDGYDWTLNMSLPSNERTQMSELFDRTDSGDEDIYIYGLSTEANFSTLVSTVVELIGNLDKPVFNFQKTKTKPLKESQLSLLAGEDVTETAVSISTSITRETSYAEDMAEDI